MIVGIALLLIACWLGAGLFVAGTFGRAADRGAPAGPYMRPRPHVQITTRRPRPYDWAEEDPS